MQRLASERALVKAYTDLFSNRHAYALESMRPHPESGRHDHYRPQDRNSVKGSGQAEGIEVFPKHDQIQKVLLATRYVDHREVIAAQNAASGFTEPITCWKPKSNSLSGCPR
jgi:hypothetical protein